MLVIGDPTSFGIGEDLLERLVVNEAGPVLGDVQLPLLKVFTKFPGCQNTTSGLWIGNSLLF